MLKYTKNMSPLHCPGVLVTIKKSNDDTELACVAGGIVWVRD